MQDPKGDSSDNSSATEKNDESWEYLSNYSDETAAAVPEHDPEELEMIRSPEDDGDCADEDPARNEDAEYADEDPTQRDEAEYASGDPNTIEDEDDALSVPSFEILQDNRPIPLELHLAIKKKIPKKQRFRAQKKQAEESRKSNEGAFLNRFPLLDLTNRLVKNKKCTNDSGFQQRGGKDNHRNSAAHSHVGRRSTSLASCTGYILGFFASNVLTFALGYTFGWWVRDSLGTFAVYELHFDPLYY